MATAYTQVLVKDLDILPIYKKLMGSSVGQGSIFLKVKETITDYVSTGDLTAKERADIVSKTIIDVTNNMTAQTLTAAIQLSKINRDATYELTKLKEDTRLVTAQIAKVEKDTEEADWSVKNRVMAGWKVQAELYRDYGVQTWNQTVTTDIIPQAGYVDYGIKTETIKKAKADIYQGYAQGYRTNGYVSVVLNSDGSITNATAGDTTGLTYQQTKVAIRQEQGFDDNMRQHVVNSSASMISTLLATEASGIDYDPYLLRWRAATDYLNNGSITTDGVANNGA